MNDNDWNNIISVLVGIITGLIVYKIGNGFLFGTDKPDDPDVYMYKDVD
jgi:hypothetical protein